MTKVYDCAVVGAGIYGCTVAIDQASRFSKSVLLLESENTAFAKASSLNQARVHAGYHYPRSLLTAHRCKANYAKFIKKFSKAISHHRAFYGVSVLDSHVNADYYSSFCGRVGIPLIDLNKQQMDFKCSTHLIEKFFEVEEMSFDFTIIKDILVEYIQSLPKLEFKNNQKVKIIRNKNNLLEIENFAGEVFLAKEVFLAIYSATNEVLSRSNIKLIPIEKELAEICFVQAPAVFSDKAVTIMDGPFFSLMPFPSSGLHSFSHVRFTPHFRWQEGGAVDKGAYELAQLRTNYELMKSDAVRYLPDVCDLQYVKSVYVEKSILPKNSSDDGRPILFIKNHELSGLHIIIGSKVDNIFDLIDAMTF